MGSTASTAIGVQNINGNKIVGAFTKNGASGNMGIYNGTGSSVTGAIVNNNNNEFSNITLSGTTFIEGWRNTDGGSTSAPTKTINNNKFENWSGGTGIKTVVTATGFGGASSISNNTINNINTAIGASGNMTCINAGNLGVANPLNISSNIITNINGGTGFFYGITTSSKSTNVNIETNQIKNVLTAGEIKAIESLNANPTLITISTNDIDNLKSSAIGGLNVNGIFNSANVLPKIENNSIKNLECTSTTNAGYIRGINITNAFATATPPIINNNVIDNLISASTSASTTMAGIAVAASANHEITNNTIKNLTSNTSNSGTAGSTAVTGIWTSSSGTNQKINNNLVFNINANNSTTANVSVAGILTSASSTAGSEIYQNRVYGLKNLSTGTSPIISGYLNAGGGVWTTANNMISIDNGANTNGIQIFGINDIGNNGARKYFYNSINIDGTSTALNSTAFQFKRTAVGGTADIRNNIFNMKRTGGTSKNYAVANTGTFTSSATAVYNYNIFNAPIAAQTGLIDTTDQTFASWKTATAGDTNSFSNTIVNFTDVTVADLHLLQGVNCDSGNTGTPVTITTDFDNQTRDVTFPTIGADETTRTNTDWNGTSWSNGAPTLSKLASFSGSYDMTLGVSRPSIDACSMIINSGTVTVATNKFINIQNDLTINTGTTLNVLDKGSLVMVNNAGIVTNNGTTNISRLTPSFDRYDYTYWSSPTKDPIIATPLAAWNLTRAYSFTTANYLDQFSGNSYPQTTGSADTFDDNGDDWTFVPSSTPMSAGVGYAVMGNALVGIPNTTETVTFSGKVNNGIITYPLALSNNPADNNDDFNLVGNPYPSSIKADDFIKANILPLGTGNNISGTLYFWSHKGNVEPVLTNPGPNVFNYNANDYASYNLTGSTTTSSPSGSGSATPDGFIGSGQGFMVEAAVATNLVFSNSLRNKSYSNIQFFKNNSNTKDRFWLNFQNIDNMFSQQLIGYLPSTSLNYDYGYDGIESKSQNYVSFYSFIDAADLLTYKIQSRDLFDVNDYIKLGYTSAVSGQTSISIDHTEGIFDNQDIYLQDNLLNITHNLTSSPYAFTTNYGTFNDRFILKYVNTTLSNIAYTNNENAIKIAVKDLKIAVLSTTENIKSIQVFDILGRSIYDNSFINAKTFTIENLLSKNQVLIVKTRLDNGVVISRKVIL